MILVRNSHLYSIQRGAGLFVNANPQVLPIHTNSTHTIALYRPYV